MSNELQIKRYRKKYKNIKMTIKGLILENAALCDEVAKVQESIIIVKDERRYLLHKLVEYEAEAELAQPFYRNESMSNGSRSKIKKRQVVDDVR